MKSKILKLFLIPVVFSFYSSSSWAEDAPKAKAAELSLHRIERLVILNRIDAAFQTQFQALTLTDMEQNSENIKFLAVATQFATTSTPNTINIYLDPTGRAVRSDVVVGTPADGAPTWGAVDPVTLAENSLHYIEGNAQAKPELIPFNRSFKDLTIVPGSGSNGVPAGVVDIHSTENAQTLRVFIRSSDGTFDSATIF